MILMFFQFANQFKNVNGMPMIKPGKYRHFKGNEYEVLDVTTHSETLEPMVVYLPLW